MGEAEPFLFRPAERGDLPFIMATYGQVAARSLVAAVRDEALWRFDLERRHEENGMRGLIGDSARLRRRAGRRRAMAAGSA